jgi:rhodanese-related sulfurtransferase
MKAFDEIAAEEALRRLAEFHVIDVRGDREFRGPLGRVSGARLVPLPELEARAADLPKGRPLLLVCRSGARSGQACEKLVALGVGPVVNLRGGMIAWTRAQLPVEHSEPASLRELMDQVISWVAQVGARDSAAVREELRGELARRGLAFEQPTHESIEAALVLFEASFRQSGPPPDLEPSLASFRRWLAVL